MSILIPIYGFFASVLPVWLLLLPRDYLSTFLKIGTIGALAIGIAFVMPELPDAGLHGLHPRAAARSWAVPVIPFIFITIACGALSGFHATIGTGTTPEDGRQGTRRALRRLRRHARWKASWPSWPLIAACVLVPADYFAINAPGREVRRRSAWPSSGAVRALKPRCQESLMAPSGRFSVSLAVGMAHIFCQDPVHGTPDEPTGTTSPSCSKPSSS